jgi:hypothetical protein
MVAIFYVVFSVTVSASNVLHDGDIMALDDAESGLITVLPPTGDNNEGGGGGGGNRSLAPSMAP